MAQGPLFTVHWKTFAPMPNPVTVVLAEVADVIVPVPLTKVQRPVAGKMAVLPDNVALLGVQTSWSTPAVALGLLTL